MAVAKDTFRLDIEFAGMCMFVRDPTRKQMHVLLPQVGGHLARLFYAPKHGDGKPCQTGTAWPCENLDGVALDLTEVGSGASGGKPDDPDVADLSEFLKGKPVPRRHLDKLPTGNPVLCRVTLDDGARIASKKGIKWTFGANRPFMAISLTWQISKVEAPLRLKLGAKTLELIPDKQQIQLAIFNAPFDELPDLEGSFEHPKDAAHHFDRYYDLFDGVDAGDRKVPEDPEQNISRERAHQGRGRRFTCIVAQAVAEP